MMTRMRRSSSRCRHGGCTHCCRSVDPNRDLFRNYVQSSGTQLPSTDKCDVIDEYRYNSVYPLDFFNYSSLRRFTYPVQTRISKEQQSGLFWNNEDLHDFTMMRYEKVDHLVFIACVLRTAESRELIIFHY